jgi:hypothetical protein
LFILLPLYLFAGALPYLDNDTFKNSVQVKGYFLNNVLVTIIKTLN